MGGRRARSGRTRPSERWRATPWPGLRAVPTEVTFEAASGWCTSVAVLTKDIAGVVDGRRVVVDATYSPDVSQADRDELQQLVESIRFG